MQDYDVVVIGSGAGGLTAALALARAGRRVAVFEQHHLPGGYSQTFSLRGYQFSPGVHYVGALGPDGSLRRLLVGLGVANDLLFLELDPDGYDRAVVGDARFDIPKGRERFAARLKDRFPAEADGIDRYFALVARMGDELGHAAPVHGLRDMAVLVRTMPTVFRHGLRPIADLLDGCTRDPWLRAILTIQSGDYGMPPSRAPAALHAAMQGYYFEGAWYPRGGAHALPKAFIRHLRRHGGELHLRTEVAGVLIEGGRAIGVRLADGREVRAATVVSNADPGVTWGRLVPAEHQGAWLRHRIRNLRYSVSTLSLFLAVDMDLRAAGLTSGNVWWSRTPDVDRFYALADRDVLRGDEAIEGLFLNATTLKDPLLRRDGRHTIEAMAVVAMAPFAAWRGTMPGARPAEYARLKAALADRMLEAVARLVPGIRAHVVEQALGTPLTNTHYLHATDGGIYGTEKTVANLGPFGFSEATAIPGLFQCGASILAPGIAGVTASGLNAAAAALGCAPAQLLTATGQEVRTLPSEHPEAWLPKAG
jgi:all-trans-retinol 13,14-reductase